MLIKRYFPNDKVTSHCVDSSFHSSWLGVSLNDSGTDGLVQTSIIMECIV